MTKLRHILRILFTASLALLLTGCKLEILNPKGMVAASEMRLLIDSVLLMCIIVVPVLVMVVVIGWIYRSKNKDAEYKPNWGHSYAIEIACWSVPCAIIIVLATMTWVSSHKLDPYKPIVIKGKEPVEIQVIALDWKWLFIYPKQGIATVNYFRIPVNTPIRFHITADAPMNSFAIPQLAGQIYAMGAMGTRLSLVADEPGVYNGFSTNYSGDGFAGMQFKVYAGSDADFTKWVATVKKANQTLDIQSYVALARPSTDNPIQNFSSVSKDLFMNVMNMFSDPAVAKEFATYRDKLPPLPKNDFGN